MVRRGMMFGEIISTVGGAFSPEHLKLALANAITDPIESDVDGFGAFLLNGIGSDAARSVIVSNNGSGGLGVTHFLKSDAERTGVFAIMKEGTQFGLGGAGENFAHDMTKDVNGAVGVEVGNAIGTVLSEKEITGGARAGFGDRQVRRITLDGEEHIACSESDGGVGMGGAIIQQLREFVHCMFCSMCLFCG